MFDIGLPEIAVIVVLATFLFGPDRLPDLARQAARFLKTARQMVDNAKADIKAEVGDDFGDLKNLNLRDLDPREIIRKNVIEEMRSSPGDKRTSDPKGKLPLTSGERAPFDADAT